MRGYMGIAIISAASAVHASPLTQIEADVDGDGVRDRVSVESTGKLVIQGASRTVLPLGSSLAHAQVTATVVRSVPTLIVTTTSGTDEQTTAFVQRHNRWRELVRERTGPASEDGDYAIALTAEATGIYRYQSRPGLRRCDGKPGLLFADGWNGSRFQRLSKIPSGVPTNAAVVTSRMEAGPSPAPLVFQARAASHQPGAANAAALTIPTELGDGTAATFWQEEFASSAGEGQFFTFEPRTANARASRIRIVPRPTTSTAARAFNRPRRLAIVGAQSAWHIDLPDAAAAPLGTAYIADLPSPIEGCVTIVLESTYGPANGRTAIAELAVFAEAERSSGGGEAALARAIAEGNASVNAAARALGRRGAAAVPAIDRELARATDVHARHRLTHALIAVEDPAAGPSIARALAEGAINDRDVPQAVNALAAMRLTAQLREIVAGNHLALEIRVAAARALAGDGTLLELAGMGPQPLRWALVDAMSTTALPALIAATRNATTPAACGDLWRAVTRRALAAPQSERPAAISAMLAAIASTSNYEIRYRLIEGIAALGDATALGALQTHVGELTPGPNRAAFKHVAARTLARYPRGAASTLLRSLAADPDPGVRMAALSALGAIRVGSADRRQGPPNAAPKDKRSVDAMQPEIDRTISVALTSDVWPEVRRAAARTFAAGCADPEPALVLARSVRRDPNTDVRIDALSALVECNAARAGELLVTVWNDAKLPVALRTTAIELSPRVPDPTTAASLVAAFDGWQRRAADAEIDLALAQRAALALGHLAPPEAGAALARTLDTSSVPELTAAVAAGLGALGPKCPASAKGRLQALAHAADQQLRVAAAQAAVRCGR